MDPLPSPPHSCDICPSIASPPVATFQSPSDSTMMGSPPDSTTMAPEEDQQEQMRIDMERRYFVPGEITFARSDEEKHFLSLREWERIKLEHWIPRKTLRGLPCGPETRRKKEKIYPPVKEVIKQYWLSARVDILEVDMRLMSGLDWFSKEHEEKAWLVLTASEHPLLKQMARQIGNLLDEVGYPELECLILQDTYSLRAGQAACNTLRDTLSPQLSDLALERARHFGLVCGNAVGPYSTTSRKEGQFASEGTMGFYLTNGEHVVGVSNSHVLGYHSKNRACHYRDQGWSGPKLKIQMPTEITYDYIGQKTSHHISVYEKMIAQRREQNEESDENEETRRYYDEARQCLGEAKALQSQTLSQYASAEERYIGHTLWTSGLSDIENEHFSIDVGVALLRPGLIPQNRLPLVDKSLRIPDIITFMALGNPGTYPTIKISNRRWIDLRANKFVPRTHFYNPPPVYQNGHGDSRLATLMTGRTSGTTVGCLDAQTCERTLYTKEDGTSVCVQEYTVSPAMGNKSQAFTEKGDSGSMCIVPDEKGHALMLGLVHGGSGLTDRTDKTYIYPMFHFFEKTLPRLVKEHVLPEGPKRWSMDLESLTV